MSTNKPMPAQTEISAPFWEGLKSGRLTLPRCNSCGHWIFYPRRHCNKCWSHDLAWHEVSGAGSLYTPWDEMLATSDIITLHCPLTPQTRGMIAMPEFRAMVRRPLIINTGRGGLVDEAALEQFRHK